MTSMVWIPGWSTGDGVFAKLRGALPATAHRGCDMSACVERWQFCAAARAAVEAEGAPVDLVGWSMGAMVALEVARDLPHLVQRLVLISASPRFVSGTGGIEQEALQAMRAALPHHAGAVLRRFWGAMFTATERACGYAQDFAREHGNETPAVPTLDAGLAYLGEFAVDPGSVRCETHLLHGGEDVICPLPGARVLAAGIGGARLTVWPGVGHAPLYSRVGPCQAWLREAVGA